MKPPITESVLTISDDKGNVIAMVRKDTALNKNLIYSVSDGSFTFIEELLSGTRESAPLDEG